MDLKKTYIELPIPSVKTRHIDSYFNGPENSDNLGFVRCKTCYVRFSPNIEKEFMIEHLKTHDYIWTRYMNNIESFAKDKYNHSRILYDDPRKNNDLKLSHGISSQTENIVIRFPKCRTKRIRYHSTRWKESDKSWNKQVADEYQNNHIGAYQGNFDKPICDTKLRCGNWGLFFNDFVSYRHEPVNMCKVFDVNPTKYKGLESKDKIKAYFISNQSDIDKIAGPATLLESQKIVYTCTKGVCIFPCLCKGCILGKKECEEHTILHPFRFDAEADFFTVRNSDGFDITCNTGKITFSNSMEKGYEMIYDVYKYAGIKRNCLKCTEDVFHHQAFHFIYHDNCKFCRTSRHRIEGITTHAKFLNRFENRRERELLSCHYCFRVFSSVQFKNKHVKSIHENNEDQQFACDQCEIVFDLKKNLLQHVQTHQQEVKGLKCGSCAKTFKLKQNLDTHVKSIHNKETVKCDVCDKTFNRQSNLTSHYKYVHDILENYLVLDDGLEIQYYECDECPFETRYLKNLRRHNLTEHSDENRFNCMECSFTCNRMDNLHLHIKNIHQSESKEVFSCNICDFTSKYKPNLRRHVMKFH